MLSCDKCSSSLFGGGICLSHGIDSTAGEMSPVRVVGRSLGTRGHVTPAMCRPATEDSRGGESARETPATRSAAVERRSFPHSSAGHCSHERRVDGPTISHRRTGRVDTLTTELNWWSNWTPYRHRTNAHVDRSTSSGGADVPD